MASPTTSSPRPIAALPRGWPRSSSPQTVRHPLNLFLCGYEGPHGAFTTTEEIFEMTGNLVPELKKIASTLEPDNVMIQRS